MKDLDVVGSRDYTANGQYTVISLSWLKDLHFGEKARPNAIDWSILTPFQADFTSSKKFIETLPINIFPSWAFNFLSMLILNWI